MGTTTMVMPMAAVRMVSCFGEVLWLVLASSRAARGRGFFGPVRVHPVKMYATLAIPGFVKQQVALGGKEARGVAGLALGRAGDG